MRWSDIHGWFDWHAIYDDWIASAPAGGVVVEIGSFLGRSAAYAGRRIAELGRTDVLFLALDHCLGSKGPPGEKTIHHGTVEREGGTLAGRLHLNLLACGAADRVAVLVCDSARAAGLFSPGAAYAVFVDGAHDYESVRADLAAWWPKIRAGGRMAGHDYSPKWPGVPKAVDEFFGRRCPSPRVASCWEMAKP